MKWILLPFIYASVQEDYWLFVIFGASWYFKWSFLRYSIPWFSRNLSQRRLPKTTSFWIARGFSSFFFWCHGFPCTLDSQRLLQDSTDCLAWSTSIPEATREEMNFGQIRFSRALSSTGSLLLSVGFVFWGFVWELFFSLLCFLAARCVSLSFTRSSSLTNSWCDMFWSPKSNFFCLGDSFWVSVLLRLLW